MSPKTKSISGDNFSGATVGHALVTGAAHRIGRKVAIHFAARGWAVSVHYHQSGPQAQETQKIIRDAGGKCEIFKANLSEDAGCEHLIPRAAERFGPVTCLVNNAARFEKDALMTVNRTSFDGQMHVNLYAPLKLMQAFAAQSLGAADAQIINLTDGGNEWSNSPQFLSYALSKNALWDATQMLAKSLAPRIRVNAIALGPVLAREQTFEADLFDKIRARSPLGRLATPDELCRAIDFLLNVSSVTGQQLFLNGGLHL